MTFKLRTLLWSMILTFAIAVAGGIVTYLGMDSFQAVQQPPLSPPAFLFPVVWTILFALMAFGAAVVYDSDNPNAPRALFVYALQLTMNFWWCVLFFGFGFYLFALIWLLLLWIAVLLMLIVFTGIVMFYIGLMTPFIVVRLARLFNLDFGNFFDKEDDGE